MRQNLPIVNAEVPFPRGRTVVSATDTQGRIVYCNAVFVELSGFSREELMGQPHNIIRHPEMPPEAYRDLWDTVTHGHPWTGIVKNRRKDGRFYWAQANVTPLMRGNQLAGFLSVRVEPSRAQVEAATQLYARMRAPGGERLRLKRGQLQGRSHLLSNLLDRVGSTGLAGLAAATALGAAYAAGHGLANMGLAITLPAGLALAVLAGGLAAWQRARLVGPMRALVQHAHRLAACDLSRPLDMKVHGELEELRMALSQLGMNLRAVVTDTRMDAVELQRAVGELAAANADLAERTQSQAASLQQTSASMQQVTGNVRQSADAASAGTSMAASATQVAEASSDSVARMTQTMQDISTSSAHIAEIIQVIESIAFQTNILALNAAVEAARAGEQGRGFSVVASEVRALAGRTTEAARQIKQLIEQSVNTVAAGNALTANSAESMRSVLRVVQELADMVGTVTQGTQEQLQGISQINEAVGHMDTLTQRNAQMVDQVAASAYQLQERAKALTETVQLFHVNAGDADRMADAVALRKASRASAAARAPGPT